jgi:hypothetical protein
LPQARRIPLSRRSHIIGFQVLPNGTASHESALERDFVTLTSFSNPAAIIRSQPVTIGFDEEGFPDAKMAMLALTRAHTLSPATFRTLLAALPDRSRALATLWRLIARGQLHTDLSAPITMDSELRPA